VTTTEGDMACADADRWGTIVASDISTGTNDAPGAAFDLKVFPNPTRNFVNIEINSEHAQQAELVLLNNAGQVVWSDRTEVPAGIFHQSVDTRQLPDGFYFLRVQAEKDQAVRKIVVQ